MRTQPMSGSARSDVPNPANAPIGSSGRRSDCERWRELILAKQDQGLSAKRIHQISQEQQADVSYDSIRRYLKRLGRSRPLPLRRMECEPGGEARSTRRRSAGGWLRRQAAAPAARLRRASSRTRGKAYRRSELSPDDRRLCSLPGECLCLFGGVPKKLIIDNLRAAVDRRLVRPGAESDSRRFVSTTASSSCPTRPYTPRRRGVRAGIGYVKNNPRDIPKPGRGKSATLLRWGTIGRHARSTAPRISRSQGVPGDRTSDAHESPARTPPLLPGGAADGRSRH